MTLGEAKEILKGYYPFRIQRKRLRLNLDALAKETNYQPLVDGPTQKSWPISDLIPNESPDKQARFRAAFRTIWEAEKLKVEGLWDDPWWTDLKVEPFSKRQTSEIYLWVSKSLSLSQIRILEDTLEQIAPEAVCFERVAA
ncbi:MAG TPA: hypothetical protein VJK26_01820 [Patescibacteria group bacterium]|nr:hypothetical protein [Patescibacteria group bacterium]